MAKSHPVPAAALPVMAVGEVVPTAIPATEEVIPPAITACISTDVVRLGEEHREFYQARMDVLNAVSVLHQQRRVDHRTAIDTL